tara:strand:- start:963 stop:1205 length:243 start_codon:yes stop_codon:yes gene_type:complete
MTKEEVLNQVETIFRDVLDEDDLIIKDRTTANEVDEWDSLNHIQLVVAIEKHFKIRFTSSEIQGFSNVGEMCESISKKLL